MGARGIYTAQEEHLVNLIPPVDVNGGKTSGVINLKNYAHLTIILQFGATSAVPSKVSLLASDNGSPESTAALGFDVFKCETAYGSANGDVLGARVAATAANGFAPSGTDNIFYVIEVDAATLPAGKNYVELVLANPSGACLASAVAVLSGARYDHDQSETVLT
jgi:hypothetical protein